MELFDENLNLKIESIVKGLWTINPDEFYVEIEIIAEDKKYYHTINKNELAAVKTQIDIAGCNDENFRKFKKIYSHIKKYQKLVTYLNLQGIRQFEKIERKQYDSFKDVFSVDFSQICDNNWETKYISKNIQHLELSVT